MAVLGILINILIWKYRSYANLIIYFETLDALIGGLMPLNYGVTNTGYYFLKMVYENVLYAVDIGPSIIVTTIAITIILLIEEPVVYDIEINMSFVIAKLSICILTFVVCTLLGMVVVYIV